MIAWLSGILNAIGEEWIIIDCGGIGYQVYIIKSTLTKLPSLGEKVTFYIEHLFKNEAQQLVGFLTNVEHQYFRLLISVPGVGMKMALSILSILSPEELNQEIINQNKSVIMLADGVGAKIAGRVILELKNKVPKLTMSSSTGDAFNALTQLGYSATEAQRRIKEAKNILGEDFKIEDLIKQALKTK